MRLHHVLLAIPPGGEASARAFLRDVIGMTEVARPAALAGRVAGWFRLGDLEIHIAEDAGFVPARKAHPGIEVHDLDGLAGRVSSAGHRVEWDDLLPGRRRFYTDDPFGNRLEFLGPEKPGRSG
ncbi:MAG: glyoxalase [Actinobacteria bacterium]|nr:glyoxalase [Actinomycetota bacterium]MBU1493379.1 glyoxalase [Actinomycetota bacterium]